MGDMVISGAPVSVLIDHGLAEGIVEKLVAADIGTVERLGSMTPEELEAIPDIDEATVSQIQSAVVSFYGQYDNPEEEAAPVDAESIETAIDATTSEGSEAEEYHTPPGFENIETGVLEHDLATHEPPSLDQIPDAEVLDLGRVEGLSAAPSTLRDFTESDEAVESTESATMEKSE
jgi:hypothetical protein